MTSSFIQPLGLVTMAIEILMVAAQITGVVKLARLGRTPAWYLMIFSTVALWSPFLYSLLIPFLGIEANARPLHWITEDWEITALAYILAIALFATSFALVCLRFRKLHQRADQLEKLTAAAAAALSVRSR